MLATILTFIIGLYLTARSERIRQFKERKKLESNERFVRRQYLLALREEIGLNIEGLNKSIVRYPDRPALADFLAKSKQARPLITFNYYSVIFRNRTEVLQDLPDTLIKNIVDFYGKLDEIALDCQAIDSPSFVTISQDGRLDTMIDIRTQICVAKQQGETMRDAITQHLTDKFGAPGV